MQLHILFVILWINDYKLNFVSIVHFVSRGRVEVWQWAHRPSTQVWFTLISSITHHSPFILTIYPCRRFRTDVKCALQVRNHQSDVKCM